jgi:hypothetical protein
MKPFLFIARIIRYKVVQKEKNFISSLTYWIEIEEGSRLISPLSRLVNIRT